MKKALAEKKQLLEELERLNKRDGTKKKRMEERLAREMALPLCVDMSGKRVIVVFGVDMAAKTFAWFMIIMRGYKLREDLPPGSPLVAENLVPDLEIVPMKNFGIRNFLHPAQNAEAAWSRTSHIGGDGAVRAAGYFIHAIPPPQRTLGDRDTSGMIEEDDDDEKSIARIQRQKEKDEQRMRGGRPNVRGGRGRGTKRAGLLFTRLNVKDYFLRPRYSRVLREIPMLWKPYRNLWGNYAWPELCIEVQPAVAMYNLGEGMKQAVSLQDDNYMTGMIPLDHVPTEPRQIVWKSGKGIEKGEFGYLDRKKAAVLITRELGKRIGVGHIFKTLRATLKEQGIKKSGTDLDDVPDAFLMALRYAMYMYNEYVKHDGKVFYKGRRPPPSKARFRYITYDFLVKDIIRVESTAVTKGRRSNEEKAILDPYDSNYEYKNRNSVIRNI